MAAPPDLPRQMHRRGPPGMPSYRRRLRTLAAGAMLHRRCREGGFRAARCEGLMLALTSTGNRQGSEGEGAA